MTPEGRPFAPVNEDQVIPELALVLIVEEVL
jgi:hypothetical protein